MNIVTLLLLAAFQLELLPCGLAYYSANFCHGCRLTLVGRERRKVEKKWEPVGAMVARASPVLIVLAES